jgi:uroporphyrinogen decarboxylase
MDSRERVLCACSLGIPDRVPRAIGLEHGFAQTVINMIKTEDPDIDTSDLDLDSYFKNDSRYVGIGPTRMNTDFSIYFDRTGLEFDEWGCAKRWDNSRHYAEYFYPLAGADSVEEIDSYPWPDYFENYRYEGMDADVKRLHDKGLAVLGGPSAFFEIAWQIRSMERLMEDMVLDPAMADAVYERILERNIRYAQECARADVDILFLGDDVAMQTGLMMSPDLWRRYLGRSMKCVIDAAKKIKPDILAWYHSDGDITQLIPDLIDAGINILNPLQPECVDADYIKKQYGGRLAFWGAIGVQSVIPFGTPDEVYAHVCSQIKILGKNGGFVAAPSHVLERDTPLENLKAMIKAIDDCGTY